MIINAIALIDVMDKDINTFTAAPERYDGTSSSSR